MRPPSNISLDTGVLPVIMSRKMKRLEFSVTVLFIREEARWVAQCLEYDIAAQADTIAGAKRAFSKAFVSQVATNIRHGKRPLQDVPKAPGFYFDLFKKGERLADRTLPKPVIPDSKIDVVPRVKELRIAA
jgi:hypothetical protein